MSEPRPGADQKIHHSTAETRERAYDRARQQGIPADTARAVAEQATRQAHTTLDRRR